jgi:hypothetical protein
MLLSRGTRYNFSVNVNTAVPTRVRISLHCNLLMLLVTTTKQNSRLNLPFHVHVLSFCMSASYLQGSYRPRVAANRCWGEYFHPKWFPRLAEILL